MAKYSKGDAIVQSMKNAFPVSDLVTEKDRMMPGDTIVITVIEVVDPLKRKLKIQVNEGGKGFEPDEEVTTFVPTALFNLLTADEKRFGEPIMVEYNGLTQAKEKNASTGTKCKYHDFKIFAVK